MIMGNCLALGMADPCDAQCRRPLCLSLQHVEHFIFAIFSLEMLVKMVALGVCGKGCYFTDPWNCFDCFIVFVSAAEYAFMSNDVNFSAIRAIRVLRPLRAINRISSLRLLVTLLIDTLPMLGNVLLFCFFIFFVFGIVAVQLWAGMLRNRCFFPFFNPQANYSTIRPPSFLPSYYTMPNGEFICSTGYGESLCSRIPEYEEHSSMCANTFGENDTQLEACQQWVGNYSECLPLGPNPERGALTFDNIGFAWITVFQVISLQGWTEIMYLVQDAYSFWVWIYFAALIWVGAYLAVNFCLVVITTQFSQTKSNDMDKMRELGRESTTSHSMQKGLYQQVVSLIRHLFFTARRSICALDNNKCRKKQKPSKQQQQQVEVFVTQSDFLQHNNNHSQSAASARLQNVSDGLSQNRTRIRRFLENNITQSLTIVAIVINAIIMSTEHYGQPQELAIVIEVANLVFTVVFSVELILKFYAYGPIAYITKGFFNLLDTFVVLINVSELFSTGATSGYSVLRLFRLFRLVKIIHYLPQLQKQLMVMLKTIDNVMSFFFLLSFFIYVTSLLGMNLFGCKFPSAKTVSEGLINASYSSDIVREEAFSQANFDSLLQSTFTVLQVLTQDNWSEVMRDGMFYVSDWAGLFFVSLVAVGNYILFNLLVAILVEGFSCFSENDDTTANVVLFKSEQNSECSSQHSASEATSSSFSNRVWRFFAIWTEKAKKSKRSLFVFENDHFPRKYLKQFLRSKYYEKGFILIIVGSCVPVILERPGIGRDSFERSAIDIATSIFSAIFAVEALAKAIAFGFVIGPKSYLQTSNWNVMDFCLVILALIDVILQNLPISQSILQQSLRIFCLLRCLRPFRLINRAPGLQVVLKALAFCMKPIGNTIIICLFLFVIFAILGVQLFSGCFASCKPPTLVANDSDHVTTNLSSFDWADLIIETNVTSRDDCLAFGFEWTTERYNFDSLPNALLALFVFSTRDGWTAMTKNGVRCVGKDKQPIRDYNFYGYGYFISFLLIVCFFTLNMFVGVVVNNFDRVQKIIATQQERKRRKSKATAALAFGASKAMIGKTGGQEGWSNYLDPGAVHRTSIDSSTEDPEINDFWIKYPKWRQMLFNVVTHKYFELVVIGATCINVLVMAAEFYMMPPILHTAINIIGYIFMVAIILEALLKLVAWGSKRYITQRWNQIDLAIVVLSVVGKTLEVNVEHAPINPMLVRATRVFRIARVFKLLKSASGVRQLLLAITQALPHVVHLSLLFLLIFIVYASLGVQLYGLFECRSGEICMGLSRHANFHNVGMAMLTLFRIFTGDNWNEILKDVLAIATDPERCSGSWSHAGETEPPISCTVIRLLSPGYFISFVLLTQFVLINIVVAVLMRQLEEVHNSQHWMKEMSRLMSKSSGASASSSKASQQKLLAARSAVHQYHKSQNKKMPRNSMPNLPSFEDHPDPSMIIDPAGRQLTRIKSAPSIGDYKNEAALTVELHNEAENEEVWEDWITQLLPLENSLYFIDEDRPLSTVQATLALPPDKTIYFTECDINNNDPSHEEEVMCVYEDWITQLLPLENSLYFIDEDKPVTLHETNHQSRNNSNE